MFFSAGAHDAIGFLNESLKKTVTAALAEILTEKPDRPIHRLATLLKQSSFAEQDTMPPIQIAIEDMQVTLTQPCPKSELTFSKQSLYGLHMPSTVHWQNMLDIIAEDHPSAPFVEVIVEMEDPGHDLVFLDGVPLYSNISKMRAQRRRKEVKGRALNEHNLSRLGEASHRRSLMGGFAINEQNPPYSSPLNRDSVDLRRLSTGSQPAMSSTQRPATATGAWPPPKGGASTEVSSISGESVPSMSRHSSRSDVQMIDLLKSGLSKTRKLQTLAEVLPTIRPERRVEFHTHLISPADCSKNPLALYDKVDKIIGVNDTETIIPVLVISFRSREAPWRHLMAVAHATMLPMLEFTRLKAAERTENVMSSERRTLMKESLKAYWTTVTRDRATRDALRKTKEDNMTKAREEAKLSKFMEAQALLMNNSLGGTQTLGTTTAGTNTGDLRVELASTVRTTDSDAEAWAADDARRVSLTHKRERRRQREDVMYNKIDKHIKNKNATKIQALVRGALCRGKMGMKAVFESTAGMMVMTSRNSYDSAPAEVTEKIQAPALIRRVYHQAIETAPDLLTAKPPAPRAPATKHTFWVSRKENVPPQYEEDVSSDEENFEKQVVVVPPASDTRRPLKFNALLRLNEANRNIGNDMYDWALGIQREFKGATLLQSRAYEAIKQHALDLVHVVFVEIHHRKLRNTGVKESMVFSDFVKSFFFEMISWFSAPHFLSLSTAPETAAALMYGPANPLTDRVLYQSCEPIVLPWGRLAPSPTSMDDGEWFLPHWNDEAPLKVLTTLDLAPVRTWRKQIEYVTLNQQPVWWFSTCEELAVYINNQPFVAAKRPPLQMVEGCVPFDVLQSDIQVEVRAEDLEKSLLTEASTPRRHRSVSMSPDTGNLQNASSVSFNIGEPLQNTPHTSRSHESLTFTYNEGVAIRLRSWFGVHWTEMERRLRGRLALVAAGNNYHIPSYTTPTNPREKPAAPPTTTAAPGTEKKDDDVDSVQSEVRPVVFEDISFSGETQQWYEDTHEFSCACYTEAKKSDNIVRAFTNIIPPPKPVKARIPTPEPLEQSRGRRSASRSNLRSMSKTGEGRARSMRRLKSIVSVRSGDTTAAPSLNNTTTTAGGRARTSMSGIGNMLESLAGNTQRSEIAPQPTISDVLSRIRTGHMVAEKLFTNPKSRYIRSPGLQVSGYQWWCNLDQFISLVFKGLRNGANVVVAISEELQLFYSMSALLVAHAGFAEKDEILEMFQLAEKRRLDAKHEADRRQEAIRKATYDPDNLARSLSSSSNSTNISNMLASHSESALLHDIAASGLNSGDTLSFLDSFVDLVAPACNGDTVVLAKAFNAFLEGGGANYFHGSLQQDILGAERSIAEADVRGHIVSAVRKAERYAALFLVYVFLHSLARESVQQDLPSFVTWLFHPRLTPALEWLNYIDPWMRCPQRSPDPNHARYSSIYRRWTEETFITEIH